MVLSHTVFSDTLRIILFYYFILKMHIWPTLIFMTHDLKKIGVEQWFPQYDIYLGFFYV